MAKGSVISIETTEGEPFALRRHRLTQVKEGNGYYLGYSMTRTEVRKALATAKGETIMVSVNYTDGENNLGTTVFEAYKQDGQLSIGCKDFTRWATRKIVAWARQAAA